MITKKEIHKIHRTIKKFLMDKDGFIPSYFCKINIYNNTRELLWVNCDGWDDGENDFREYVKYHNRDFKKSNYLSKNPYWRNLKWINKMPAYNISGLSSNPISLSYRRIKNRKKVEIAFLLLHELAHRKGIMNEKKADTWAIKEVDRMIKKGLIDKD